MEIVIEGLSKEYGRGTLALSSVDLSIDGGMYGLLTVVSTLHLGESVRYRVVGEPEGTPEPEAAEPSLEDGYVWLMRKSRAAELA